MRMTEGEYKALMKSKGIDTPAPPKKSKYKNVRTNGYDSAHEAQVAAELHLRAKAERLTVLEQIPFRLTASDYIADFVLLHPDGKYEVWDAKGFKTDIYKLKKKELLTIWNVEIIEV